MRKCAKCGEDLSEGQQFGRQNAMGSLSICEACGSLVGDTPGYRQLHRELHSDQRLWMETLALRLGEMHGYMLTEQVEKAVQACQELLDNFPKETK